VKTQKKEFYVNARPEEGFINVMLGSGHDYIVLCAKSREAATAFVAAIPKSAIYDGQRELLIQDIAGCDWLPKLIEEERADNVRAEIARAIAALITFLAR